MTILVELQCAVDSRWKAEFAMPSLFRFLVIVGLLAGIVWGAMEALVTFVEPQQREMSQTLPASKLNK